MWLLGCVCRWTWALYNACSSAVVKCSGLYPGSAREASRHAVFVNGRAPKSPSLGPWDMYSVARKGSVMGLQCITRLMLKQLRSVSYKMSGMCHGSSHSSCWCCGFGLCSFRSFVRGSLYVEALCRSMAFAITSGNVCANACGLYILASLASLAFDIGEISRPSEA